MDRINRRIIFEFLPLLKIPLIFNILKFLLIFFEMVYEYKIYMREMYKIDSIRSEYN